MNLRSLLITAIAVAGAFVPQEASVSTTTRSSRLHNLSQSLCPRRPPSNSNRVS
ncbi:hypothetical protein PF005_g16420 [Phytophthora fragariae]|uniref:RxLR effector protein n=1 Tax=Phytophthora fragariae TaxID=53985 RepID=A0A6A3XH51_9STRA|nr:hypothetical protein PF003_g7138 [Phytophthora fragariae]KAE9099585.1 hypothetical protein PF007_g15822 [Phytophthora fragariae]KAE9197692.1 hypothetical protein PF005_g16420 [Phytophthora fragariae]KAE9215419.1 hypothetical protein PF002_g17377 [Phytophthora fragariae]